MAGRIDLDGSHIWHFDFRNSLRRISLCENRFLLLVLCGRKYLVNKAGNAGYDEKNI